MDAQVAGEARNAIGAHRSRRGRRTGILGSFEDSFQLALFDSAEADPLGEQSRVTPICDNNLVLAGGMQIATADDTEFEEQLLHILRKPLAAGRVRNLESIAR